MRHHRLRPAFILLGLLAGCTEHSTEPSALGQNTPSFAILDGARGGDPRFYFLPPMVPPPSYSGTFDASRSPVVHICELSGTTCGATVATFSGTAVKLDIADEAYKATWTTRDAGLDPAKTYRIQVLIGTSVLGHADVVVVANGSQIRTVDRSQFVPVIDGQTLNIRFRIEQAAPTPPPPPPPSCAPGALGCGWQDGQMIGYTQASWGDPLAAGGALLTAHYDAVYALLFGVVVTGNPIAGFTMIFTGAGPVLNFMPSSGPAAPLNANLVDPTSSAAGIYAGEVLGLRFNIDFSDAGYVRGSSGIRFGELTLCGFAGSLAGLNGLSIRDFSVIANDGLAGAAVPYSIVDLNNTTFGINTAFVDGVTSAFAQQHVVNGACDGSGWKQAEIITYPQLTWGQPSLPGGAQILANYDAVYAATFGEVEVGLPGAAGFSIVFTNSGAVLAYLPSTGSAAALNAGLVDPTSSASGIFGGEVLALRLNIDFSDAGYIRGTSPVPFGDLTLCGFTGSRAGLNGTSVRGFSDIVNTALGGGATLYELAELNFTTFDINNSFTDGVPTAFAEQHLVRGACP
jgi:hypothetical protein